MNVSHSKAHTHDTHHHVFCIYTHTSRGKATADCSVEAGLTDAWIWIKHTAQFDLAEPCYLSITAPFILERQLISVQHQRAQAPLEAVLSSRRAPCATLSKPWPSLASP